MSANKRPIDWLSTPKTQAAPRSHTVFTSVYQCRHDRGQGEPTGKYQVKFFVARYVSSPTAFTTRVQNKLVVGLATWREQREVGRRTFEAALVVDVFSNKGVQVVKEIVKMALLAEKLVATIHIDDPVARKPQDKPPDEAVLEVHEDVDEERVSEMPSCSQVTLYIY